MLVLERDRTVGLSSGARGAVTALPGGRVATAVGGGVLFVTGGGRGALANEFRKESLLIAHAGDVVTAVAGSPSGRQLATGAAGGDVRAWDVASVARDAAAASPAGRLEEHDGPITALAFSDDGRLLLSASAGGAPRLLLWEVATGRVVARAPPGAPGAPILAAAFGGMARDVKGRTTGLYQLATAGVGGAALWALDPLTGALARESLPAGAAHGARDYAALAWAPDARHVYLGTTAGAVVVVHVRTRGARCVVSVPCGGVAALCVPPAAAVPAGGGGAVHLWVGTTDGSALAYCHATAGGEPEDDERGARGGGGPRPVVLQRRARLHAPVWCLAPAAAAGDAGGGGGVLAATAGGRVYALHPTPAPASTAVSIDAAAGGDAVGVTVARLSDAPGAAGAGGGGGGGGVAGGRDGDDDAATPLALDAVAARVPGLPRVYADAARVGVVASVAYAARGSDRFATCGADNAVRVWDAADGACVFAAAATGAGHATAVALGGGGEFVVSGWEDGGVRAYAVVDDGDAATLTTTTTTPAAAAVRRHAVSGTASLPPAPLWIIPAAHARDRGGRGVASGASGGGSAGAGAAPSAGAGGVACLALSANDRVLATGGRDGAVRVWDARSRALLLHLPEHAAAAGGGGGPVLSLAFACGDTRLASVGRDRALLVRRLPDGRVEARAELRLGWMTGVAPLAASSGSDPTALLLVTPTSEGRLAVWAPGDAVAAAARGVIPAPRRTLAAGHAAGVHETCIAAAHGAAAFVATGDTEGSVRVWDAAAGVLLAGPVPGHSAAVAALAFSPDDRQLVSVGRDGAVVIWNVFPA